jgi:regulator of protease activity HflC (stomatin/prohibitin superfamily)
MLPTLLDFIIPWIWFFLFIASIYYFVRTAWREGIIVALRKLFSHRILLPVLLAASLSVIRISLVFIYPQEVGVVISLLSKNGIRAEPFRSGLHWIVPLLERVVIYPIYWQTYTMSGKPMEGQKLGTDSIVARTSDGQEVTIDCSLIFAVDAENVITLHINWQDRYVEEFIRPALRAVTRTHISQYTIDEVNSNRRQEITNSLEKTLINVTENNGVIFKKFFLRNIAFSSGYAQAVEQKQMAEQGTIQKEYEALQMENLAKGEAARVRIRAEGEAKAILIKAQAEAKARLIRAEAEAKALQLIADAVDEQRDLLTYNYIDKLSPNIKALILPHNTPLILPLPSLDSEQVPPTDAAEGPLPPLTPIPIAPTVEQTPSPQSSRNQQNPP